MAILHAHWNPFISLWEPEECKLTEEISRLETIARKYAPTLLLDTEKWIHRRVERVEYTESDLLKWHFSVDFTITTAFEPFDPAEGRRATDGTAVYYAPVALLRKWPPLMNLSVRDEAGHPVPLLTLEKNRRVDAEALIGLMPRTDAAVATILKEIVFARDLPQAKEKLNGLVDHLEQKLPTVDDDEEAESWRRLLVLATNLAWNSLVWIRVVGRPEQRHLIKVSFERLAPPRGPFFKTLRATIGNAGEWIKLDLRNLGERGSYHLEFTPPRGTDILDARLDLRDPLPQREKPLGRFALKQRRARRGARRSRRERSRGAGTRRTFRRSTRNLPESTPLPNHREAYCQNLVSRAYFYVAESSGQRGTAYLRIGPTRREFLTGAVYAALLTTALLWFSFAFAEDLVEPKHEGPTVTAFLLLPALLSYLFTQPLPHPIARRMIAGVRLLTRFVTLLPVVAALMMLGLTKATGTGNPDVGLLETSWLILAVMASMVTFILAITAKLLPRAAVGETYVPY